MGGLFQNRNFTDGNVNAVRGSGVDPDAQAFIAATGISGTNATAINQLVLDLKAANIWSKMKAVYPMVGGTATSHKFNLKNPLDTNAAFRLSFVGGWTHSSTGATPPGGGGAYADTFIVTLTQNSTHLSYYSRTNASTDSVEMGFTAQNGVVSRLSARRSGVGVAMINTNGFGGTNVSVADSRGHFMANRTASNNTEFIRNAVTLGIDTTASAGTPTGAFTLALGSFKNTSNSPLFTSNKECAFASVGDGLISAEVTAFYTAVQTYQTTLGRQV